MLPGEPPELFMAQKWYSPAQAGILIFRKAFLKITPLAQSAA
jgi:hypothetical protein